MDLRVKAWQLPPRLITGAYFLNAGLSKRGADDATASQLRALDHLVKARLASPALANQLRGRRDDPPTGGTALRCLWEVEHERSLEPVAGR
jgi:hypothetical protein